jgi:IMP dehydrogenase
MCKALAIGADSVMLGRLVAGCDESPGKPFLKDGKFVKMFRGMAGLQANIQKQLKTGK